MRRPSTLRLVRIQTGYQWKLFWRNPVAAFFTILFPVMMFLIFTVIFGNERIDELGVTVAQFYAPALGMFAAVSATYTNLGISTAYQRDFGVLKRIRGTPLPPWIYMAGKILSAIAVAFIGVAIMLGLGVALYGLRLDPTTLPALVVSFVVGSAAFSALGLLVAAVAPSGNAASAITNATLLPLAFFSGVFIPPQAETPRWIEFIGDVFPLKHFNEAFFAPFDPRRNDLAFEWGHLAYLALWGLVGGYLAIRWFRWELPQGTGSSRRRSTRR